MGSIFAEIFERETGRNRPAILGPDGCDYGTLLEDAERLAAELRRQCPDPATPVILALPHGRRYVTALLAVWRAGLVAVPLNLRAPAREQAQVIRESGAHIAFSESALPDLAAECGLTAGSQSVEGLSRVADRPGNIRTSAGDAVIIFTSGSTGKPKGVVLTDDALSANIRGVERYLSLSEEDRIVTFTPPSYAYAINQILTHLHVGAAIFPWPQGLLFPSQLVETMRAAGATGVQANPTIFELLLSAGAAPIETVRYIMSGGQPLFSPLVEKLKGLFPDARVVNMYGCTECAPRISYGWIPDPVPPRQGTWPVGKAIDGMSIRVVRPDGAPATAGEVGEIQVRGSSLMRGYLGDPELTESRIVDGWFRTMDTGFLDQAGDLSIVGRLDNIFSVGHEKVAPEEIEEIIGQIEGVDGVAVGGAPDAALFRRPVALIETNANWEDLVFRIRSECSKVLSRTKIPRDYVRIDRMPRTPYGKIDRRGVAELIENEARTRTLEQSPETAP